MNIAFLRSNVVVCIAPTVGDAPAGLVYDATRDGTGAVMRATWNGSAFVPPPVPVEQANEQTLRAQAVNQMAANRTYAALASPTAAQNTAQIKALTQQINGVFRLLLGQFDGVN